MKKSTTILVVLVVIAAVALVLPPMGTSQDTYRSGGNMGIELSQRTGGALPVEFSDAPPRGFDMDEMRGGPDGMAMRGISPNMLLRIRADLTAELREIQRAIGFLDPNDARLAQVFNVRKNEALQQLKEIDTQLKSLGVETPEQGRQQVPPMGIPGLTGPTAVDGTNPAAMSGHPGQMMFGNPRDEKGEKPVPGFGTGSPMSPNSYNNPNNFNDAAGWDPRMEFGNPAVSGRGPGAMPTSTSSFDPWQPQPNKEMLELKQSVSSLQNEVKQLREQIQSLETQIQLLTRSILQSTASPR